MRRISLSSLLFWFCLFAAWSLAYVHLASAVTPTGFLGDDYVARGYNSLVGVWIPVICLGGIVSLAVNFIGGFVRIGTKVAGVIASIFLLGGGLSYASSITGGAIATSLILP